MAIYRVVKDLWCGNKPGARDGVLYAGSISDLGWLSAEQVGRLMAVGAISRPATPPLAVLPGWKLRAGRLQQVGIMTVSDFLEADPAAVAEHMEVKSETVDKWRESAMNAVIISAPPPRRQG